MRILGIDPGSRLTGYGCIDHNGNQIRYVSHGTLKLANTSGKACVPLEDRLYLIYLGLDEVIQKFKPQVMSIERVFFAKNAVSALRLGHARGAAILTGKMKMLDIVEYSPTEVKKIVTGYGQADKEQIFKMVKILVNEKNLQSGFDASDALALAICHAFSSKMNQNFFKKESHEGVGFKSLKQLGRKKKGSLAESVGFSVKNGSTQKLKKVV